MMFVVVFDEKLFPVSTCHARARSSSGEWRVVERDRFDGWSFVTPASIKPNVQRHCRLCLHVATLRTKPTRDGGNEGVNWERGTIQE